MANRVTISELVHKLVVDSTDLDKNLIASRKEISTAKRALRELRSPMEQYEKDLKDAETLLKFGTDGQELYNRAIAKAEKKFKGLTGATKAEKEAQEKLNKDRKKASDIIDRQTTKLQRLERELHDVNRLHRNGTLDVRAHRKEMDRLNREIAEAKRGSSFLAQAGKKVGGFLGLDQLLGSGGSGVAGQLALLNAGFIVAEKTLEITKRIAEFGVERFNIDRQEIDEIAKSARALNIEIEELTAFQFVIGQSSGLTDEQTIKVFSEITKRASEAAQGLGESRLAFKELGLEVADLNRMSPDERLLAIADAIQEVENRSDRFRITGKLFGEENARVVTTLEKGAEAIQIMLDRAEDLNLTISQADANKIEEVNDSINTFQRSLVGVSRALTIETSDEIKEVFDEGTEFVQLLLANEGLLSEFFGSGFLNALKLISTELRAINFAIKGLEKLSDKVDKLLTSARVKKPSGKGSMVGAFLEQTQELAVTQTISKSVDPINSLAAGSREAFNIQYRSEVTSQMQVAKDHLAVAELNAQANKESADQLRLVVGNLKETNL